MCQNKTRGSTLTFTRLYYAILLAAAKFSDNQRFTPAHQRVARFYAHSIPPLLSVLLGRVKVVSRHSALTQEGFNMFLSDLDLSLIIPAQFIDSLSPKAAQKLKFIKKMFLPFLGEIEIYDEKEFAELSECLKNLEPYYSDIRRFRKINWMEKSIESSLTPYHDYKSHRAKRRCLQNQPDTLLPVFLSQWVEQHFQKERVEIETLLDLESIGRIENQISNYWGFTLSCNPGPLKKADMYLLLALAVEDFDQSWINYELGIIRSALPKLATIRQSLARAESIIVKGWERAQNPTPKWSSPWISRLNRMSYET